MSNFQKNIIHTFEELSHIPISQRHHYYLSRPLLNKKTDFIHQNEPMVLRPEIETRGIMCQPFWEANEYQLDSEGRETLEYKKNNPGFDLAIREEALTRLLEAQQMLPENIYIVLKASFRPAEVQKNLFNQELENIKKQNQHMDAQDVYDYVLQFVTDPDINIPPHSSGGTIDIELFDTNANKCADMGCAINTIGDVSWTDYTDGLSKQQIQNRQLLTTTMLQAGFANLPSEWWHYSYGDQRWAVFYDMDPRYATATL